MVDGIPVRTLKECECLWEVAVIVTVYDSSIQNEIVKLLEEYGCRNYIRMWE